MSIQKLIHFFDYTHESILVQGPLKNWKEHSHELHLLKIHSRGAPITPRGLIETLEYESPCERIDLI